MNRIYIAAQSQVLASQDCSEFVGFPAFLEPKQKDGM